MGMVINEIRKRMGNSFACWVLLLLKVSGTGNRALSEVLCRSGSA